MRNWNESGNRIPVEPIAEVIRSYLDDEGTRLSDGTFCPASVWRLAERADMHGDTLEKMLAGRNQTIDFDDADKLLCMINMSDLWGTELKDLYEQAVLDDDESRRRVTSASGARTCARRGCSVSFVPGKYVRDRKIYCSKSCMSAAIWQRNHGIKTRPRGKARSLEALVCMNGHERTPENTVLEKGRGGKDVRRCLECAREKNKQYRARRKEKGKRED